MRSTGKEVVIRNIEKTDAEAVAGIYNHYIADESPKTVDLNLGKIMKEITQEIRVIIQASKDALSSMNPDEVSFKESPDQWSKKEILGHLIDSAANNHHRFVRAAYNAAADFPPYKQNNWVQIQQYNQSEWTELIALWSAYNLHLCNIIERLPEEALSSPCNIGKEDPVSLEFVIKDYLRHLRHHMEVILEKHA